MALPTGWTDTGLRKTFTLTATATINWAAFGVNTNRQFLGAGAGAGAGGFFSFEGSISPDPLGTVLLLSAPGTAPNTGKLIGRIGETDYVLLDNIASTPGSFTAGINISAGPYVVAYGLVYDGPVAPVCEVRLAGDNNTRISVSIGSASDIVFPFSSSGEVFGSDASFYSGVLKAENANAYQGQVVSELSAVTTDDGSLEAVTFNFRDGHVYGDEEFEALRFEGDGGGMFSVTVVTEFTPLTYPTSYVFHTNYTPVQDACSHGCPEDSCWCESSAACVDCTDNKPPCYEELNCEWSEALCDHVCDEPPDCPDGENWLYCMAIGCPDGSPVVCSCIGTECDDSDPPDCAAELNCVFDDDTCSWDCDSPMCPPGTAWDVGDCECQPTACEQTTPPPCAAQLNCGWVGTPTCAWECDTPSCPTGQSWSYSSCGCQDETCVEGECFQVGVGCVDCASEDDEEHGGVGDAALPPCSDELNCVWDQDEGAWVCDDPLADGYCGDGAWDEDNCACSCGPADGPPLDYTNRTGTPKMADKYRVQMFAGDTRKLTWPMTHGACGSDVLLSEVNCIYVTITDEITAQVINSRSAQVVLNQNNGVYIDGEFSFSLQVADTTMVDSTLPSETHYAVFKLVLTDGQTRTIETELRITNTAKPVPSPA